jgi:hypothetical protein
MMAYVIIQKLKNAFVFKDKKCFCFKVKKSKKCPWGGIKPET